MLFKFKNIQEDSACEILTWRYQAPYDYYNPDPSRVKHIARHFINRQNSYYSIHDEDKNLIGFCCFGSEGQVLGGDYHDDALDIGLGLHPDLTGKGKGKAFFASILGFTCHTFSPMTIRLTVAEFNKRAIRLYENTGFRKTDSFLSRTDGKPFVIMARKLNHVQPPRYRPLNKCEFKGHKYDLPR